MDATGNASMTSEMHSAAPDSAALMYPVDSFMISLPKLNVAFGNHQNAS